MPDSARSVILLAVGGGIAAYKSAALCSRLAQAGHEVRVSMTPAATRFVGPATFAALSGRPVATEVFQCDDWPLGPHIELAGSGNRRAADLMIVAPATADLMARFAHGLADDVVTALYLQVECPVLIAPAMSRSMWSKPSVQRNVTQLQSDGCRFVGPEEGWLSCRERGSGRMCEPDRIAEAATGLLAS